jgi:hypothetical protein
MKSLYPECINTMLLNRKTKTFLFVLSFSLSVSSSFSQEHNANAKSADSLKSDLEKSVAVNAASEEKVEKTFLPSTLINWKAEQVKNKVHLKWTTTIEKNAKYYTIEKSVDGKTFSEAGRIPAEIKNENRKDYSFTDDVTLNEGIMYYRLRGADVDGASRISDVRAVRLAKAFAEVSIKTFPNPFVKELKICFPYNWQGKQVNVWIYNLNGVLVKQLLKEAASQTETVDVNQLQAGVYIVKANSGTETSIMRIIK